jgi:mRNA interferase MazF
MRRGELWLAVGKGDYADKPRPYLILQRTDMLTPEGSITMIPLTGELTDSNLIRTRIHPTEANGLEKTSDIMVDKVQTMKAVRLKQKIGAVEPEIMDSVAQKLRFWLEM